MTNKKPSSSLSAHIKYIEKLPTRDSKGWNKGLLTPINNAKDGLIQNDDDNEHQEEDSDNSFSDNDQHSLNTGKAKKVKIVKKKKNENEHDNDFSFLNIIDFEHIDNENNLEVESESESENENENGNGNFFNNHITHANDEKCDQGMKKNKKQNRQNKMTNDKSDDDPMTTFMKMSFEDRQIHIGDLAVQVIEDPLNNLKNIKILLQVTKALIFSLAKTKRDIGKSTQKEEKKEDDSEDDDKIKSSTIKLILVSLLAIFQDIIPGYFIRPLTAVERQTKVSTDVRKQRDYEMRLVDQYKKYMSLLFSVSFPKASPVSSSSSTSSSSSSSLHSMELQPVSLKCLMELYLVTSHFNFFKEIMESLIVFLYKDMNPLLWGIVEEYLSKGFQSDDQGYWTYRTLLPISNNCQKHHYQIPITLLKCLCSIKVINLQFTDRSEMGKEKKNNHHEGDNSSDSKFEKKLKKKLMNKEKKKIHISKKDKKSLKEELKWKKELEESEATISHKQVNDWHQNNFIHLFRIYFGILKKNPSSNLLLHVLEGIRQYGDLITEDSYLNDLLITLRNLLDSKRSTNSSHLSINLSCLATIFVIVHQNQSGAGSMNVPANFKLDLHEHYKCLYSTLLGMTHIYEKKKKENRPSSLQKGKDSLSILLQTWIPPSVNVLGKEKKEETMSYSHSEKELVGLLKKVIEASFFMNRSSPLQRVAAFLHRLMQVSLSLTFPESVIHVLDLIERIIKHYPRCVHLLKPSSSMRVLSLQKSQNDSDNMDEDHDDDDDDVIDGYSGTNFLNGGSSYQSFLEDPDLANALSSKISPYLSLLNRKHPSKNVQMRAIQLLKLYNSSTLIKV